MQGEVRRASDGRQSCSSQRWATAASAGALAPQGLSPYGPCLHVAVRISLLQQLGADAGRQRGKHLQRAAGQGSRDPPTVGRQQQAAAAPALAAAAPQTALTSALSGVKYAATTSWSCASGRPFASRSLSSAGGSGQQWETVGGYSCRDQETALGGLQARADGCSEIDSCKRALAVTGNAPLARDERRHVMHELHQALGDQHGPVVLALLRPSGHHVCNLQRQLSRSWGARQRAAAFRGDWGTAESSRVQGRLPGYCLGVLAVAQAGSSHTALAGRRAWRTTSLRPHRCSATSSLISASCGCVCSAHSSVTCDAARPMSLQLGGEKKRALREGLCWCRAAAWLLCCLLGNQKSLPAAHRMKW